MRGVLIAITIIGLFMTAVINFIVVFPDALNMEFMTQADSNAYLMIQGSNNNQTQQELQTLQANESKAFNEWDVTTGFMGSNQLKQNQGQVGISASNIFLNLGNIAGLLWNQSPVVVYVLGTLTLLVSIYIGYLIVQFIRSGR